MRNNWCRVSGYKNGIVQNMVISLFAQDFFHNQKIHLKVHYILAETRTLYFTFYFSRVHFQD